MLKNIYNSVIGVFFPAFCISCKMPVDEIQNCVCGDCKNRAELLDAVCSVCSGKMDGNVCSICSDRTIYFQHNHAFYKYSGIIKDIFHELKFNKNKRLVTVLLDLLEIHLPTFIDTIDMVTWVPMNKKKKYQRGFNQAYLIAKGIAKRINRPLKGLLKEVKRTETQRTLDYNSRFINVMNRYKVKRKSLLSGKRILIVDDIFTTGATLNECARIISDLGNNSVFTMAVARAEVTEL